MKLKKAIFGGGFAITLASILNANANTYTKELEQYENDLNRYKQEKEKYDKDLKDYQNQKTQFEKDLAKYQKDKAEYEKAKSEYALKLKQYNREKVEYENNKKQYEQDITKYNKLKVEWEKRENDYKTKKRQYDDTIANYKRKLDEYHKSLKEREEQIKRNKQNDEIENQRRLVEFEKKKKEIEEESKKPGRFSSDMKNALSFTHEPNANAQIDIGTGGAVALVKAVDGNWKFNWNWFSHILSSDNLDDATLKKNKLDTRVLKQWDPTITTDDETSTTDKAPTYAVLAKKNTPFKVTYTNLQNSTYDGRKISKIEYIYEVLETGSDSDLMQLNIAKDPTISVWLRGENGSPNHRTRVKLTPIFYDQNGNKIIPTKEKPIFLGMGSMNAQYTTLDTRNSWFIDGKDLFLELMGFRDDKYEYVHNKFYEKYGVKWDDRHKNGFYNTVKSEWEGNFERKHFNEWEELIKPFKGKRDQYMRAKYGNDNTKWPSQYREIVYKLTNGTFIKLNDSRVDKHPDGYYSDTNVDSVGGGWDDPKSKLQYYGAGVIQVTEDHFSMEFGSTTPKQQRFALNTIVADMYIAEKPKLELQKTPEPPLPESPEKPTILEPKKTNPPLPDPPGFLEKIFKEPKYDGPNNPQPPRAPKPFEGLPPSPPTTIQPPKEEYGKEPKKPTRPTDPDKPIEPVEPEKPISLTTPKEPTNPKKPDEPNMPNIPGLPLKPQKPNEPKTPSTPIQPIKPTAPNKIIPPDPIDADKPAIPNEPKEPAKPQQPSEPTKPKPPTEPETPQNPRQPIEPNAPINPTGPQIPIEPQVPIEPHKPEEPKTPNIPEQPVKPIEPEKVTPPDKFTQEKPKRVRTFFKDPNGNNIIPPEEGEIGKKDLPGWKYIRTETDNEGNIIHYYKKVRTFFKDTDGNNIIPPEEGKISKKDLPGWKYIRTETDNDENIIHYYKKIRTFFKDTNGKDILPSEDGEIAKRDISGWTYIRTEIDKDGNIIHIYKPTPKELPKTGDISTMAIGMVSGLLGLLHKKRRK